MGDATAQHRSVDQVVEGGLDHLELEHTRVLDVAGQGEQPGPGGPPLAEGGKEIKILRENMAFGRAGQGEFGTYFIGYARSPRTTEQMLQNMFIGRPPGNYDRLLDFSRAVTGGLFFVPSLSFLETVTPDAPAVAATAAGASETEFSPPPPPPSDGSLGIGSLKGESQDGKR